MQTLAIYQLCWQPAILKHLREAFDKLGLEKLEMPTYKSVRSSRHLEAVIYEALRLHPFVGLLLERYVLEGGARLCGQDLPPNTIIGINDSNRQ